MISEILSVSLIATTISFTAPLILAALGGLVADKSGVPNVAIEGMIYLGGIVAIIVCFFTGDPWIATFVTAAIGALLSYILGLICVKEAGDVVIGGFSINFICWGLAPTLSLMIFGSKGMTPMVSGFPSIRVSIIEEVGALKEILSQTPLTYLTFLILILLYILMNKTKFGKHVIASGLDPFVADTQGVDVFKVRYLALMISGVLAAIAGAEYSLGIIHRWSLGLSAGRGFIAIAAYLFGRRRPLETTGACFLFGFLEALSIRLRQVLGWMHGATEITQMLPLILTIIILGIVGKGEFMKFAKPYRRE